MSIDHDTFDERLAGLAGLADIPTDLAEHADGCDRCRSRLELARRIRLTAPQLAQTGDVDVDNITAAVLARTHHRTTSVLPRLLAAAAALVVVAGGAGVFLNAANSDDTDRLADIADEYAETGQLRFVYATEASLDVAAEFDLSTTSPTDIQALSAQIPTCTDTPETDGGVESGPAGGLDLEPIADALASNDPCLALQLIDDSAQPSVAAYTALAASISSAETNIEQISDVSPGTGLAASSVGAYIEDQRDDIGDAQRSLDELEASFNALADTLQPLAATQQTPTPDPSTVESDLTALRADTTNAEAAVVSTDPVVSWTQIATGTWTSDGIEIEGITERGEQSNPYTGVDDDPLALADIVWSDPGILIDLLDSAPVSDDDQIRWRVPEGVLDTATEWTATATLDDGRLIELTLDSINVSITLTPER